MGTHEIVGERAVRGEFGRRIIVAAVLAASFCGTSCIPNASADLTFCPPGSAAGQCSTPEGVAADFQSGRVYVVDRGNRRIDVFKASNQEFLFAFGWKVNATTPEEKLQTCTTATGCQVGSSGGKAGQFASPRWIAIDNVEGSVNRHDVYVVDNNRVNHFKEDGTFVGAFGWKVNATTPEEKLQTCTTVGGCQAGSGGAGECQLGGAFQPVGVGPGGNIFVAISTGSEPNFTDKVEKFSPAGGCMSETVLVEGNHRQVSLAVDATEGVYVADERGNGLRKYQFGVPKTQLCDLDVGIESTVIGLDETGHLFVFQHEPPWKAASYRMVTEYDGACNKVKRFGYGGIQTNSVGIAPLHTVQGDILLSEAGTGVNYLTIPAPGPLPVPESLEVLSTGNAKARVRGEVNPEGKATTVWVEYVDQASFEKDVGDGGDGFEGAGVRETEHKTLTIPMGREFRVNDSEILLGCPTASKQLIEEGKCLNPESEYHWRVATNNADGTNKAEGPSFQTKKALEIKNAFVSAVGGESATLSAVVDPLGIPASAYFEYVDDATFKVSGFTDAKRVPAVGENEIDFGGGEGAVKKSITLASLIEGTTYHFRLSAIDALIEERQLSEAKTFSTARKEAGVELCAANEAFRLGASAGLPDCRAYEMVSPFDKANGDVVVLPQILTNLPAVLNQSAVSGERFTYGSYRAFGDAQSAPYTSQYLAARTAGGWVSHGITPPQEALIKNLTFDFEFRAFSDDLCSGWIIPTAEPPLAAEAGAGHRNLYRRKDELCGGAPDYTTLTAGEPERLSVEFVSEVQGVSGDGAVSAFAANDSLEGSGAPAQPGSCLETNTNTCRRELYVKGPSGAPRFACVLPGGTASTSSCSAGTGTGPGFGKSRTANLTNALSGDGSRLYWSNSASEGPLYLRENPLSEAAECSEEGAPCSFLVSSAATTHFWAAAKDGSKAIYSTGSLGGAGGKVFEYDAEAKASTQIAGEVAGVLGVSEDGRRAYFASREVLTGSEKNSAGKAAEAGKPNLYMHEAGGGYRFVATLAAADVAQIPGERTSSATGAEPRRHNGRVSANGLVATFMSEAPLTGYDNSDAVSGEADNEVFIYDAAAKGGAGEILCASCNPSGGRPAGADLGTVSVWWVAGRLPVWPTALYGSHLLSGDGSRLFFESQDALVPRDSNGRVDVYQWERAGSGGCKTTKSTYSPSAAGCIDLISSGQSERNSELLDASASGNDVFFATLSSLFPSDYGLVDVYDARVGGGFAPPAPQSPECEAESCQHPPPAPTFQIPATSTYVGPDNEVAPKPTKKPCPKGKHEVKKNGKRSCVKNNKKAKKKHNKHKADKSGRAGR